jgi:hypothetical protein
MEPDLFARELIVVGEASLLKAQRHVTGCAACSELASRPFESVLSDVLEDPHTAGYILGTPGFCPRCASPIMESTLVSFENDPQGATRADETNLVFVDKPTLSEAESFIAACEHCTDGLEISFAQLLDAVTGCDPVTEYVICRPASCPRCQHQITENTVILPRKS